MAAAGYPGPGVPLVAIDLYPFRSASAFQGIGRYLRELLRALLHLQHRGELPLRVVGLDLESHPFRAVGGQELERLLEGTMEPLSRSSPSSARRWAGRALRQLNCACLHQAEPHRVPVTYPVPLVLTIHDLIPLEFPHLYSRRAPRLRYLLNWSITRFRLLLAHHVVTGSQYVATSLQRRFGLPAGKITVTYYGVDLARYHPGPILDEQALIQRKWGLEPGYWLFVGTGDPRKNLGFLLKAVASAGSKRPVVLAGRVDPRQEPMVRQAIARSGLGSQVRLLGFVPEEDLPSLYRQSLALLFPSLSEGFGLPVLEAMACGKPVLAFHCTALPEVAGDGAWLLPPGDLNAFAHAIRHLESSPEKQRELSERGFHRAQRFTWEASARQVAGAYLQAMALAPRC